MNISKKIPDVLSRAVKTFFQSFFGVVVPEVCAILMNIANGKPISELDWDKWYIYVIPVVCAGLAAGLSAVWNGIINATSKEEVK